MIRADLEFDLLLTSDAELKDVSEMYDRLVAGTYYDGYRPEDFLPERP